jgi:hypothetical protein
VSRFIARSSQAHDEQHLPLRAEALALEPALGVDPEPGVPEQMAAATPADERDAQVQGHAIQRGEWMQRRLGRMGPRGLGRQGGVHDGVLTVERDRGSRGDAMPSRTTAGERPPRETGPGTGRDRASARKCARILVEGFVSVAPPS